MKAQFSSVQVVNVGKGDDMECFHSYNDIPKVCVIYKLWLPNKIIPTFNAKKSLS